MLVLVADCGWSEGGAGGADRPSRVDGELVGPAAGSQEPGVAASNMLNEQQKKKKKKKKKNKKKKKKNPPPPPPKKQNALQE